MRTIHPLSPDLISKIAAGQVVERPASVVKELVENALDAGATHIDIDLIKGGIEKISVKDNGKGMNEADILACFLPHTTSKLKTIEELFSISSLGFRGEALASIAAVSTLTIKSREQSSEFGNIVEIQEGRLVEQSKIGIPLGTEVIVESLFSHIPARKKFLKTPKAELALCIELVTNIALSHPHIGFTLTYDDTQVFNTRAGESLSERMQGLLSDHIARHMIPVAHETRYGKIHGFIGKPQAASRSRNAQHIFVNARVVASADIAQALIDSYQSLLEPRSYPPFILFLTLPYENVDVNVDPRKQQVAFIHHKQVKELVQEAVSMSLEQHDLTYREQAGSELYKMDENTADILKDMISPWNLKNLEGSAILQIKNLYLVTMTDNGLLIVDQHAAHERILFEQFKEAFTEARAHPEQYQLAQPTVFVASASETLQLDEHISKFQQLGFDIESFGRNTYKISHVPLLFKDRDYVKLIIETLHEMKHNTVDKIDRESERTLAFLACRTAIKAGEYLSADERKKLVEKLLQAKGIYTCPHGRPTHIELPLTQLDRMFKRS